MRKFLLLCLIACIGGSVSCNVDELKEALQYKEESQIILSDGPNNVDEQEESIEDILKLLINEYQAVHTSGSYRDTLELIVQNDGNVNGYKIVEGATDFSSGSEVLTLPDMEVSDGDIFVIHFDEDALTNITGIDLETCETSKDMATGGNTSDAVYDCRTSIEGFTNTESTILIIDSNENTIVDSIYTTNKDGDGGSTAFNFLNFLLDNNGWSPSGTYTTVTMQSIGIDNTCSSDNSTDPFGASTTIQRIPNADTNTKDDWACATGTLGAVNSIQFNVESAFAINSTTIEITFNRIPDKTTAETTSNYFVNNGIGTASDASLSGKVVTISTSTSMSNGTTYTVTASNILSKYDNVSLNVNNSTIQQVPDVVISEIAWAGKSGATADEWIELYNNRDIGIDLTGWTISWGGGSTTISLSGTIPAKKHFLLERTDDTTTPKNADLIYTGSLGNTGEDVYLKNGSNEIFDSILMGSSDWVAGSTSPNYYSMERIDTTKLDHTNANWKDGSSAPDGAENSSDD